MAHFKKFVTPLLLLAYSLYAALFIYRTSFVVHGERFFSLFDDAMISMRFARNLANGHGLVWNPGGARVEGYTNLLWTLYMAAVHRLPLAPSKFSLCIQISGALCLLLNLVVVKKIVRHLNGDSLLAEIAAMLLTAFYLPLNNWTLQGMEVGLLALIITLSAWLAIRCIQSQSFPPLLYPLLGLGVLVRMDGVVQFVTIMLFLAAVDRKNSRRHVWVGVSILAIALLSQTVFRWIYYGDLLPNTYYLKMTGYPAVWRIGRGALKFLDFLRSTNVLLVAAAFGVALIRRDKRLMLLMAMFAMQCCYSVYVGGDAWEWYGGSNRYISIVMPLLFIVYSGALDSIAQLCRKDLISTDEPGRPAPASRIVTLVMAGIVFLSVVNVNVIDGKLNSLLDVLLIARPLHTIDNQRMVDISQTVEKITEPDATVAVVWAGGSPYYMTRNTIDLLGKCDRRIAHEPMHLPRPGASVLEKLYYFWPGHLKFDYAYSVGELKPDVITEVWNDEEAAPYLAAYRKTVVDDCLLYLRKDSPRIRWSEAAKLSAKSVR